MVRDHAFVLFFLSAMTMAGCSENEKPQVVPAGHITFTFSHRVDGNPLQKNELIYTNAAGNEYLITEVKYFISDIIFYKDDGTEKMVNEWKDIFYIDEDIPETKSHRFFDDIPAGTYDSITFVFGITEEKNKTYLFVNPPEVNMFWPAVLGGGYHYMMINGKWKTPDDFIQPFNFHLGIGQLYKGEGYNTDSIYAFVQNWFRVSLPGSGFVLQNEEIKDIHIAMNIESWFITPHIYDHNEWGADIMQKQPAMQIVAENGHDVFSVIEIRNKY